MLKKEVDLTETKNSKVIKVCREKISSHFGKHELANRTARLAKTASMLDPIHMVVTEDADLTPFTDHIVEIIQEIPETQMVGSSQPPVNLTFNLPKIQAKQKQC